MTGAAHLRSLAVGRLPSGDGLLGNAHCAWGGADLLSEEAILAAFTAEPFSLEGEMREIETSDGAAIIAADRALVADLYDGRIGRLWRIGGAPSHKPEPAVDVAFDADMRQERGDLSFRAEDHPSLDSVTADRLVSSARSVLETLRCEGALRSRGFVVRAFGDSRASAALIALYTMSNDPRRQAGFRFAALALGERESQEIIAVEASRLREWSPRI